MGAVRTKDDGMRQCKQQGPWRGNGALLSRQSTADALHAEEREQGGGPQSQGSVRPAGCGARRRASAGTGVGSCVGCLVRHKHCGLGSRLRRKARRVCPLLLLHLRPHGRHHALRLVAAGVVEPANDKGGVCVCVGGWLSGERAWRQDLCSIDGCWAGPEARGHVYWRKTSACR